MRALVTGSNGFVGQHLTRALAARGDEVIAFDLRPGSFAEPNVRSVAGDLRDAAALREACEGVQSVFHVASMVQTRRTGADEVRAVNVGGTEKLLDACRSQSVARMVYVSSASVVYAGRDIERGDETLPYPAHFHAPYAETKAIAERLVLESNGRGDVLTCAVRPHIVFGPGDTRFFPAVLGRARSGRLKAYVGDARKLSDFTYIDNLVDGLLLASDELTASSPVGGQAYFVTNGEPRSFWEFIGKLLDGLSLQRPTFRVPFPIAYSAAAFREGLDALRGVATSEESLTRFTIRYLTTHHYFSHDKATRDLGYRPGVSIDEGIARTLVTLR
jgi:sterol-4alpha-carboxylate 3-dehydrogenase (decarboxylating)